MTRQCVSRVATSPLKGGDARCDTTPPRGGRRTKATAISTGPQAGLPTEAPCATLPWDDVERRGGTARHHPVAPFFSVEYEVYDGTQSVLSGPASCPAVEGASIGGRILASSDIDVFVFAEDLDYAEV